MVDFPKIFIIQFLFCISSSYVHFGSISNLKQKNAKSETLIDLSSQNYNILFENLKTESSPNAQLPDTILPIQYHLQIEPEVTEPFHLHGYISIEIQVLKPTSLIVLNIKDLTIEECSLKENIQKSNFISSSRVDDILKTERKIKIENIIFIENHEMVNISAGEILQVGHTYLLDITYTGFIRRDMMGFYKASYVDKHNHDKLMLVTQFQMTGARSAFPCFDQPNYKSIFTVAICRPANMTTLSNMPIQSIIKRPDTDGVYCDIYQPTVKMPTYLLAFAITDYKGKKCHSSSVPMQVYGAKNDHENYEYACWVATELLRFFEEFTGIAFALPKIDLLSVPEIYAFGMENYGLITIRENLLIVNKSEPNVADQELATTKIIAHELAHQWFGNLVTTPSWSSIWLFEGLATYLSYVAAEKVRPDLEMMRWFYVEGQRIALEHDAISEMTRPLSDSNIDLSDVYSIFNAITYWKSSSIMYMLAGMLTFKTFQRGVSSFLVDFAFDNADETELWRRLTEAGHQDKTLPVNLSIQTIMKGWLNNKGYPIVSLQLENGTLTAVQESIFEGDQNSQKELLNLWWIRINLHQYPNVPATSIYWMTSSPAKVILPEQKQLYVINPQQVGFYRVNYNEDNWIRILKQLTNNHTFFDDITKMQLIDDVFTLANKDRVNYSIAMDMLQLLKTDTSLYPLYTSLSHMSTLISIYDYDKIYGSISRYFDDLLKPHFERVTLVSNKSQSEFESNIVDFMIFDFCKNNLGCVQKAVTMFQNYLTTNISDIKPSVEESILCIGITEGGILEWNFLWNKFKEAPLQQLSLGRSLTCSRPRWMLSRYYDKLAYLQIPHPIFLDIMEAMAKNPFGIDFVWDKIRESWQQNEHKIHGLPFSNIGESLLRRTLPYFRNHQQYNDVLGFLSKKKINPSLFSESLKTLREKLSFHDDNYDELLSWKNKKIAYNF